MSAISQSSMLRACALIAILFVPAAQAAIVFSELNAFGASMAVSNPTPFTNGNAYVDYLASDLGIVTINNSAAGGDQYAEILSQINTFISNSGGTVDPDGLYVLGVTIDPQQSLSVQADTFASGMQALFDAGAQYMLAPNAHDFSMLPSVPLADKAAAKAATESFNSLYAAAIAGLGFPVMEADFFGVYNSIAADPGAFGISNIVDPCFDGGLTCADPGSYFFWDTIHPTTVVHRLLANELTTQVSNVPLPATLWLFGSGFIVLLRMARRRKTV